MVPGLQGTSWLTKGMAQLEPRWELKTEIVMTTTNTMTMTTTLSMTSKVIHRVEAVGNHDNDADNNDDNDVNSARFKVIHTVGAVGRVEWRDLGGHNYSGVFKGAQHGLVRWLL